MGSPRNIESSLVEAGQTIRLLGSEERASGFVVRTLVGRDEGYFRGSLITVSKQPGESHRITATEQNVRAAGESVSKIGRPHNISLKEAMEIAPIRSEDPSIDFVAHFIGEQILSDVARA